MDRVRLGRVLGRGARMAARTAYDAVDAATSASPTPPPVRPPSAGKPASANSAVRPPVAVHGAVEAASRIQTSARKAQRTALSPVKRASKAVSLEITGSFFALFALSFAVGAWRLRPASVGASLHSLWACTLLAALFSYFSISNFLRARRLSRPSASSR